MMMMMAMGAFSGDFILLGCDGTFGVNFCVEMGMMLILDGVFFYLVCACMGAFFGLWSRLRFDTDAKYHDFVFLLSILDCEDPKRRRYAGIPKKKRN